MPRAIVLVSTNPASAEDEDEFNRWYDTVHVPQIVERVPGITTGRRFTSARSATGEPPHSYLALYEIDADDPDAVVADLAKASSDGRLEMTGTIGLSPVPTMVLYREI